MTTFLTISLDSNNIQYLILKLKLFTFFQEKYQVGVKSTYPTATDTILIFLLKQAPIFVNTFNNYSGLRQHTDVYSISF